ncbi:hypothetical protein NGA_0695200, partial [Nannochloropsis gaditana CCMP526]|uniref:uncharacterized protein n=1 Tax=Nannochloropsis gaditana (strain CCMP526) TaxID=1093141 RepID=UPI00029F73FF
KQRPGIPADIPLPRDRKSGFGVANVPQTLLNGISMIFDANHVVLDYATGDYRAKVLGPPYSAARASGLSGNDRAELVQGPHAVEHQKPHPQARRGSPPARTSREYPPPSSS